MIIMTAGMHPSGNFRSKRKSCFFRYRKSIYIGPESHRFSRMGTGNPGNQSCMFFFINLIRNSPFIQNRCYPPRSFCLLETEFRMPVKLPAQADDVIIISFHQLIMFHMFSLQSHKYSLNNTNTT